MCEPKVLSQGHLTNQLYAGCLSLHLTEFQRTCNYQLLRAEKLSRIRISQLDEAIEEQMNDIGTVPSLEYLCAKLPDLAADITFVANIKGIHGDEYSSLLDECRHAERRAILEGSMSRLYATVKSEERIDTSIQSLIADLSAVGHGRYCEEIKGMNARDLYKDPKSGPMLYIEQFDWPVGPIPPGRLVCIGAYVGNLKTTYGLNIVYNNAIELGYNIAFISLEMHKEMLYERFLIRHSLHPRFASHCMDITMDKFKNRALSTSEEEFLFDVVEKDLKGNPEYGHIYFLDSRDFNAVTPEEIEAHLASIDAKHPKYGLNMVMIDYLQLFARYGANGKASDGYYHTGTIARWSKDLATRFLHKGLTVFMLAQFSRAKHSEALEEDNYGRYDLDAFAESAEIERACDIAVSIFYGPEEIKKEQAKMQLLKNRDGKTIDEPFEVLADPGRMYVGDYNDTSPSASILAELLADEPDLR